MASLAELPLFSDVPHWSMQVVIEEQVYTFRFMWNARESYWYVHLLDDQEAEVTRSGQKVIPLTPDAMVHIEAMPLLDRFAMLREFSLFPGTFPGVLYAFSETPLTRSQSDLNELQIAYLDAEGITELIDLAQEEGVE
jgi:hypothetical protein